MREFPVNFPVTRELDAGDEFAHASTASSSSQISDNPGLVLWVYLEIYTTLYNKAVAIRGQACFPMLEARRVKFDILMMAVGASGSFGAGFFAGLIWCHYAIG